MSAMTDHKASLPKVSSAASHRNGNAPRNAIGKSAAAARTQKPINGTNATQSTAHVAKQTNSMPRSRSRPTTIRSLSSPLGRSNSVRVSKKERRWSERLGDPKSPTTYTDHFQDPLEMSDKLRSLNLETTPSRPSSADSGGNTADTTYEQSFRWPRGRGSTSFRLFHSMGGESASASAQSTKSSSNAAPREKPSSGSKEGSANPSVKPASGSNGVSGLSSNGPARLAGVSFSVPFPKKNDLSQASGAQKSVTSSERKPASDSRALNEKQMGSGNDAKAASDVKVSYKPVNGVGPVAQRTSQSYRTANGITGSNIFSPASDSSTPRRSRVTQQKSSSPFVYGSDSGSWV